MGAETKKAGAAWGMVVVRGLEYEMPRGNVIWLCGAQVLPALEIEIQRLGSHLHGLGCLH